MSFRTKVFVSVVVTCFMLNLIIYSNFCWYTRGNERVAEVDKDNRSDVWMVVVIMTAPTNKERRDTIRQTWMMSLDKSQVRPLFVYGESDLDPALQQSLSTERSKYNDMLSLSDFKDSYNRLTEKLVRSIDYVYKTHKAAYLMKCDDDTFIQGDKLLQLLGDAPTTRYYTGYFTGAARVKTRGQWAEPNFHLCDRYLPYARGGGYIITFDLVEFISKNKDLLQVYRSEDVSLGVWLAPLSITRQHDVRFDTEAVSRGCSNNLIVSHKQSIQDMLDKHKMLQEHQRLCMREVDMKPSYEYNWSVPPSQCCG